MKTCWNIVNTQIKRDQLSFNYIVWKLDFKNLSYINGGVRSGNYGFIQFLTEKDMLLRCLKSSLRN